jgi:hypothetical protein
MAASTESGRAFDAEYRIVRPGGEERTVHVRAQPMIGSDPLSLGGGAHGVFGISLQMSGLWCVVGRDGKR